MIILIAIATLLFFYSASKDAAMLSDSGEVTVLNKGDFAVTVFTSLRRHLEIQGALLGAAMGVFESGYGKSRPAQRGFNIFSITDVRGGYWSSHGGETWFEESADDHYDSSGQKSRISQTWRIYTSIDQAVDDYISFLKEQNGGRYKKAYAALVEGNAQSFVTELYKAGYFTFPPDRYLTGINGALKTVKAMTGIV